MFVSRRYSLASRRIAVLAHRKWSENGNEHRARKYCVERGMVKGPVIGLDPGRIPE